MFVISRFPRGVVLSALAVVAATSAAAKLGDVDGDDDVDLSDLGILLSAYGTCVGDPRYVPEADFNGPFCIDLGDLGILLANYGT